MTKKCFELKADEVALTINFYNEHTDLHFMWKDSYERIEQNLYSTLNQDSLKDIRCFHNKEIKINFYDNKKKHTDRYYMFFKNNKLTGYSWERFFYNQYDFNDLKLQDLNMASNSDYFDIEFTSQNEYIHSEKRINLNSHLEIDSSFEHCDSSNNEYLAFPYINGTKKYHTKSIGFINRIRKAHCGTIMESEYYIKE